MNRRGFLKFLGAGVAGIALAQAIPLGRVWSFPSKIVVPGNELLRVEWVTTETLRILKANLQVSAFFRDEWSKDFQENFGIGDTLRVKLPQLFQVGDYVSIPAARPGNRRLPS